MTDNFCEAQMQFRKKIYDLDKRSVKIYAFLLIFNICFVIFDYYADYHGSSSIIKMAIGAMWVNLFWGTTFFIESLASCISSKQEYEFWMTNLMNIEYVQAYRGYKDASEKCAESLQSMQDILKNRENIQQTVDHPSFT